MTYHKPVDGLVLEYAEQKLSKGQKFNLQEIYAWFVQNYPKLDKDSVRISINKLSINDNERKHQPSVEPGSGHDVFFKNKRNKKNKKATYRLWDKEKDPSPEYFGENLIDDVDKQYLELTDDPFIYDQHSAKLRGKKLNAKGNKKPTTKDVTISRFKRDPAVKATVEELANGICELCNNAAPFIREDGRPFLEIHHVQTLADGGPDTIDNAVALCPNCHRACHYSSIQNSHIETLYSKVKRLIKNI